jgi:hypothetical protein
MPNRSKRRSLNPMGLKDFEDLRTRYQTVIGLDGDLYLGLIFHPAPSGPVEKIHIAK